MPTFQEIPPSPEEALDRMVRKDPAAAYGLVGDTLNSPFSWRSASIPTFSPFATKGPKTIVVPYGDGKEK